MSSLRLAIVLVALSISAARALPAPEEITVSTRASASASDIYAWLDSGDPRLVAWGGKVSSATSAVNTT